MKSILVFLLFALAIPFVSQANAIINNDPPVSLEIVEKDFPLFKDIDFEVIYVDFEPLTANIQSLRVVSEEGEVVYMDDVSDESVDAIYEIDYAEYNAGKYRLELFTYAGSIMDSEFVIEK